MMEHIAGDDDVIEVETEVEAAEDAAADAAEPIGDLDDVAESPELDVAEGLRAALGTMREESDRIAGLGTGEDQVVAAERFAEGAGTLDEQIGAAARNAEGDGRG